VLVWSKSAVVRTGLQSIVQAEPDLQLVGLEKRLADFCDAVREAVPDVVLLDVEGFARVQLVELESPAVVALVTTTRRAELQRLLHDGIRAILMRDVGAAEIVAAIRAVANGLAVISPEILDVLLPVAHEAALDDELPAGEPLTAREAEVLAMLADGAANKEIAARLGLSEHTVKFHVSSILNKMGATTRTEAVARGYREGLIAM
jgi:DNA-binding NarL/FixJ family response regulator